MVRICGVGKRYFRVAPQIRSGMEIDVIVRDMSYNINSSGVRVPFASLERR